MGEIIAGILCVAFVIFMFPYIILVCKYIADDIIPAISEFLQNYKDTWHTAIKLIFK